MNETGGFDPGAAGSRQKDRQTLEVLRDHGKGSHYRVSGDRFTTIKSGKAGELKPGYVALIKKQLGIE
jgi:hypothetical protein